MKYTQHFPASFLLLQQEGYLISSCLATGLTELRAANVHNKGAFYSALFNLSVGIERLLKSVVIMDHMLKNSLSAPSKKQLKRYGHDISELYDTAISIANNRNVQLPTRVKIGSLNQEILTLLSNFAQTTRFHNLDALNSAQTGEDPLAHWGKIILSILKQDVSVRQRNKILAQANMVAKEIDDTSITIMQGLDQLPISTEEALSLPGLHDQAVKHAVLRILTILLPVRELVSSLSHEAYSFGDAQAPFPQMQEFIEWLCDDRQYVLRKKKWP